MASNSYPNLGRSPINNMTLRLSVNHPDIEKSTFCYAHEDHQPSLPGNLTAPQYDRNANVCRLDLVHHTFDEFVLRGYISSPMVQEETLPIGAIIYVKTLYTDYELVLVKRVWHEVKPNNPDALEVEDSYKDDIIRFAVHYYAYTRIKERD